MIRVIALGVLVGLVGCGDNAPGETGTADATADAGIPADACVMAQGNCGCVFENTVHYGPGGPVSTTVLVCP